MNAMETAHHPSRTQVEALLDFLHRNPGLPKGFSKVPSANFITNIFSRLQTQATSQAYQESISLLDINVALPLAEPQPTVVVKMTSSCTSISAAASIFKNDRDFWQKEQPMEVDLRNLLLLEAIINHTCKRDNAIEECRMEVDHRNSLLLETIVNSLLYCTQEHDYATTQALLDIGEGLKLLGP